VNRSVASVRGATNPGGTNGLSAIPASSSIKLRGCVADALPPCGWIGAARLAKPALPGHAGSTAPTSRRGAMSLWRR